MNSVIQNLKNISIFTNKILKVNDFNDKIISSFQNLLQNLIFSNEENVSLLEFKKYFSSKYKTFEGNKDNDSTHFLIYLINYLHKTYNNINNTKISKNFDFLNLESNEKQVLNKFLNSYESRNNSFIHDLFYGYQMFKLICSNCDHSEVSFQSFNILDIPLMDGKNSLNKLYQCINSFLYTKSNQNTDFECKNCNKSNNFCYLSSIIYLPKILIINLKRLGEKNEVYNHYVDIPEILETNKIEKLKCFKSKKYLLKGFICHYRKFRHNIAYLKNISDNKWYEFNDQNVKEEKNISFANAILLFYEISE